VYPLKTYLLKPHVEKNLTPERSMFNYRLSRACRCIECAFGILYSKWCVLGKDIETSVETAILILKCACILHNVVQERDGNNEPTYRIILETATESDASIANRERSRKNNRATDRAVRVCEAFTNYFTTHRLVTEKL
jgi:hypothetical protein